jgi:hypothetical protein
VTEKYAFIDAQYASSSSKENAPAITQMCAWLKVSRSGYYDWLSRPESATAKRMELLKIKIKALRIIGNLPRWAFADLNRTVTKVTILAQRA